MNPKRIIRNLFSSISMIPKMMLLTLLVGAVVWGAQDLVFTKTLKKISDAQLNAMLSERLQEDRIRFDNYLGNYHRLLQLISSQEDLHDYLFDGKRFPRRPAGVKHYSEIPPWLPDASVMRNMAHIHYAVLMDGKSRVREVYQGWPEPVPHSLLQPSGRLIQMSLGQSYLTYLDGFPYLLTSESIKDSYGNTVAILMISARLNNDFLISSQGLTESKRIVGLAEGSEKSRVIASNRPDLIPEGTLLDSLRGGYVVIGKSFFDWGASEVTLQFTSFMPKSEFEKLNESVLGTERLQRAIVSILFILSFVLIMFQITRHIRRLTRHVTAFSQNTLGTQPLVLHIGDELLILKEQFQHFTREIIESRDRLKRQAEELLREKTVYLDNLLYSSAMSVIATDLDFRIKYFNPAAERFFGYRAEDVIGRTVEETKMDERLDPPCLEMLVERIRKETDYVCTTTLNNPDGVRFLESRLSPILDKDNKLSGFMLISLDITESKLAKEALAAERERLAVTLKSIGDGVIATDTEGKILLLNNATEEMTGWSQDAAVGRHVNEIFHIIDEKTRECCENPVSKVLETGAIVYLSNHTVLIARDGAERVIADSGAPIRDRDGRIMGAVLVFRDITEKQRMEVELSKAQRLESLGVLAGGIAHDFNNMLTSIMGYASLAKDNLSETEILYKYVDVIERAASKAADLTRQLLGFARGGKYVIRPIDLNDVVDNVLQIIKRTIDRIIDVRITRTNELWTVEADQSQIEHVLLNLCINARDAMPDGGILRIETLNYQGKAPHPEVPDGRYAVLKVSDTGVGIDRRTQQRIFEPFFTTKEPGKGTGMGLAMAYGVIQNHGGFISVDSKVGKGSVFTIYLPATEKTSEVVQPESCEKDTGKGTVLIVDDEYIIRSFGKSALLSLGYKVFEASDGLEAVEIYKQKKDEIDVVVLDVIMPRMGGGQAFKKMKEINPDVKVLLSSGYSISDATQELLDSGARGFLQKPFDMKKLSREIRRILT